MLHRNCASNHKIQGLNHHSECGTQSSLKRLESTANNWLTITEFSLTFQKKWAKGEDSQVHINSRSSMMYFLSHFLHPLDIIPCPQLMIVGMLLCSKVLRFQNENSITFNVPMKNTTLTTQWYEKMVMPEALALFLKPETVHLLQIEEIFTALRYSTSSTTHTNHQQTCRSSKTSRKYYRETSMDALYVWKRTCWKTPISWALRL